MLTDKYPFCRSYLVNSFLQKYRFTFSWKYRFVKGSLYFVGAGRVSANNYISKQM